MKQVLFVFALLCSSLSFAQGNFDRIEGFRDINWGSHVDSIYANGQHIVFTPANKVDLLNGGKYFVINNDNMLLGNLILTNIYYVFSENNNRLYKVILEGKKNDVEQMEFIVDYKYGDHLNEKMDDDKISKQWLVQDVTLSLYNFNYNKFEFELLSDWEAAEAYKKNTNVSDF
ncbi:MAG: hypothetical protein LRY27_02750 [Chitinophagales bacterium]|nr:hypothetical protein [Chitinophagales bacterium]